MFCIKPYLNETERGEEGGLNAALAAGGEGARGSRRGPGSPRGGSVGFGHGMAPRPPPLTCRRLAHLGGPARPARPGAPRGPVPPGSGAAAGAVAPLIRTDRNKRAFRSDSQAFIG